MDSRSFIKPKLSGKRFEDHGLPFDLMEDLSVFEELLLKTAKWVFLQNNPDRQRVPKGFGKDVSLKLIAIEPGSTIPNIILAASSFVTGGYETYTYFDEAKNVIFQTISAAQSFDNSTYKLPSDLLKYFERIGKNLKDDEEIDFLPGSTTTDARLTVETRRRLALASPDVQVVESKITVRGLISEWNKGHNTFMVTTTEGLEVVLPLGEDYESVLKEAFDKFDDNCKVIVSGTGIFNKQNRLENINPVESVTVVHPLDVATRFEEFLSYEQGWMDGSGSPFRKEQLQWLSDNFDQRFSADIRIPYSFPMPDNSIQFEWKYGPDDLTLDVDLNAKKAYYHYLNTSNSVSAEGDLDLSENIGWDQLITILNHHFRSK